MGEHPWGCYATPPAPGFPACRDEQGLPWDIGASAVLGTASASQPSPPRDHRRLRTQQPRPFRRRVLATSGGNDRSSTPCRLHQLRLPDGRPADRPRGPDGAAGRSWARRWRRSPTGTTIAASPDGSAVADNSSSASTGRRASATCATRLTSTGAPATHPKSWGGGTTKDNANLSTDPALIQASRDIARCPSSARSKASALIGDEGRLPRDGGFANRGRAMACGRA